MKKISIILIILCLFLVGCQKKNTNTKIDSIDEVQSKSGTLSCTREAEAGEGITPYFEYHVKYKDDEILVLDAKEGITSENQSSLDEYEQAYKKINNYYKNLKYYDSEVIRTSNSVSRKTTINYEKINIEKLIELEGEKDNIIENGKAKLSKWLSFAKKFGTKCSEE